MDDSKLYPKYRYVMGVLNFLCATFTHAIFIVLSPILVEFARDFEISEVTAGIASSVHVCSMGVFLLVGSVVIGKINVRRTQAIGVGIEAIGTVFTFFAPNFPLLLASRVMTGMGHGLSGSCTNTVVASWFPPKERSAVVTINSLGNAAIIALVYSCTVPLYHAFGDSWRSVVLLIGGILAVIDVAWIILARDNKVLDDYIAQKNAEAGKKINAFSGIKEAFSRKDVLLLCTFMAMSTISAQGISNYLPQFLQNYRGFSAESASSIIGYSTAIGAIATFAGGSFTTFLGRRKGIIYGGLAASIIFGALALIFKLPLWINIMFIGYTMASNFRGPSSQTIATELPNSTPALTSSTAAMSFGLGFIGTLINTPLLSLGEKLLGKEYSLLIFIPILLISLLFIAFVPETGPKRKTAK